MDLNSLKYAKSHEWISVQGQTATVGITDFAVKQLTDLVHIELPRKGRTIRQGETFGEVESVKAVSDLYAPATGEIVEVNEALADDLGVLSDDPFGKGWMMKLKLERSVLAVGIDGPCRLRSALCRRERARVSYLFNTPDQRREMLRTIGAESIDELFQQVPADCRLAVRWTCRRPWPKWSSSGPCGRSPAKTWRGAIASA